MPLHVLAGSGALLRPAPVPAEDLAVLVGPRARPVAAFWFSRRCGPGVHDFLLEPVRDARIKVFAQSLRENFGARAEPLLMLPDLLDTQLLAAPTRAPRAVLREIWSHKPARELVLHGIALPEGIDDGDGWAAEAGLLLGRVRDRLDALRAELADAGNDAPIATRVIELRPEDPCFVGALRNAIAHQVAFQAGPHLATGGLAAKPENLRAAVARLLATWEAQGLHPARPLGTEALARISAQILQTLLVRGGAL